MLLHESLKSRRRDTWPFFFITTFLLLLLLQVGSLSPWGRPDSNDTSLRQNSQKALNEELSWAHHLGLSAVLTPPLTGRGNGNVGLVHVLRPLLKDVNAGGNTQVWVRIPATAPTTAAATSASGPLALALLMDQSSLPPSLATRRGVAGGGEGGGHRQPVRSAPELAMDHTSDGQAGEDRHRTRKRNEDGESIMSMVPSGGDDDDDEEEEEEEEEEQDDVGNDERNNNMKASNEDPWEWWHEIFALANRSRNLGVVLELTAKVPSPVKISRWLGEPLKALIIPTALFVPNAGGFPVLPKRHQGVIRLFMRHGIQVILTGAAQRFCLEQQHSEGGQFLPRRRFKKEEDAKGEEKEGEEEEEGEGEEMVGTTKDTLSLAPYQAYLSHLLRSLDPVPPSEVHAIQANDVLQVPLQPLQDNLESPTYEIFERDTPKYQAYEQALYRALLDQDNARRGTNLRERQPGETGSEMVVDASGGEHGKTFPVLVVVVIGAGRGPLVKATLNASAKAQVPVQVIAVEKNPNAFMTLQHLARHEGWGESNRVGLVRADVREWMGPPTKADIVVSELLGSFGDNELSPECLDRAVMKFLKVGGVCIPESYTNYLQPITTAKVHSAIHDLNHPQKEKYFETPLVVKLNRFHAVAPVSGGLMTFTHHTQKQEDMAGRDNSRYVKVEYLLPPGGGSCRVDGFAGYFDAKLYGSINLSTHPLTHTPDMYSWFPIFFPLKEPVYCPAGSCLVVHMWRCIGPHKVWYEWAVTQPHTTKVHNREGSSYFVGM